MDIKKFLQGFNPYESIMQNGLRYIGEKYIISPAKDRYDEAVRNQDFDEMNEMIGTGQYQLATSKTSLILGCGTVTTPWSLTRINGFRGIMIAAITIFPNCGRISPENVQAWEVSERKGLKFAKVDGLNTIYYEEEFEYKLPELGEFFRYPAAKLSLALIREIIGINNRSLFSFQVYCSIKKNPNPYNTLKTEDLPFLRCHCSFYMTLHANTPPALEIVQ